MAFQVRVLGPATQPAPDRRAEPARMGRAQTYEHVDALGVRLFG